MLITIPFEEFDRLKAFNSHFMLYGLFSTGKHEPNILYAIVSKRLLSPIVFLIFSFTL